MNQKETNPKLIKISLMFDDEEKDQHAIIDILSDKVQVSMDQVPETERKVNFSTGVEHLVLKKMQYIITVDYGDNGVDLG